MRRLAEGRFSVNPPEYDDPRDEPGADELESIHADMKLIDSVIEPALKKLNASPGKQRLLQAVEKYRHELEKDAVEVGREMDKRRRE